MLNSHKIYCLLFLSLASQLSWAESEPEYTVNELFNLDLRTLLNLKITTASRKEETVARTAGAVSVITRNDIQRSGFLTLPEILRLAPGVAVGRVDSHKFFVSIRGFGSRFNNKLQVMIDGRKLFSPMFNGTYWEQQMPFIEDIDRIEVVRGSGGTLWGSNAMNGVINIITRNSAETTDGLLNVAVGDEELRQRSGVRQGWKSGQFSGRVYAQEFMHDDGQLTDNTQVTTAKLTPDDSADDEWRTQMGGFRTDWQFDQPGHSLMLQGESYDADYDQTRAREIRNITTGVITRTVITPDSLHATGQHLLTRYQQPVTANQALTVTAYFDEYDRRDGSLAEERQTLNNTIQYDVKWLSHEVSVGWEQQRSEDHTRQVSTIYLDPAAKTLDNTGLFIQNRFNWLNDRLGLIVGIRYDENEYTDWENQPAIKAYYEINPAHHIWSSWSQSVTTPGRYESESYAQAFGSNFYTGIAGLDPERLTAREAGYRYSRDALDVDISVYKNHYAKIGQALANIITEQDINGFEIALRYQLTPTLDTRLQYAYADDDDELGFTPITRAPENLSGAQLNWQATNALQTNLGIYYNSNPQPAIDNNIYQENTRLDINFQYQFDPNLRFTLSGQNLLEEAESYSRDAQRLNSGVERAYYLKMDWRWD